MLIKNNNHYFKFDSHVRYLEPSHDVFARGGRVECFGDHMVFFLSFICILCIRQRTLTFTLEK